MTIVFWRTPSSSSFWLEDRDRDRDRERIRFMMPSPLRFRLFDGSSAFGSSWLAFLRSLVCSVGSALPFADWRSDAAFAMGSSPSSDALVSLLLVFFDELSPETKRFLKLFCFLGLPSLAEDVIVMFTLLLFRILARDKLSPLLRAEEA